jgi:hypothetical protein
MEKHFNYYDNMINIQYISGFIIIAWRNDH